MISEKNKNLTGLIKEKASELGFDLCGIAKAKILSENGRILERWCKAGMNAGMLYLQKNIEKRINPGLILANAKSLVVTGLYYYSDRKQKDPRAPVLSHYAYGTDYHYVITPKLEKLLEFIMEKVPDSKGRVFCDSGPLLEKAWAREAGLGWQGRHSIVINEEFGSYFFIGVLVLNIELQYDTPFERDCCGCCSACIDACPTGAINDNHTIDAGKCISNWTIESRKQIPDDIIPKLGGRVYGCDACQKVCPWNNTPKCSPHPEFELNEEIALMTGEEWQSLTEERYLRLFKKTAVERIKYVDLMRNIEAAIRSMDYEK